MSRINRSRYINGMRVFAHVQKHKRNIALFFFFFFLIMYNNIKKKKKGIQGGRSSLQTDSITCGRLLLLKKKDNLE